ncbi:pentapeptide repeat-containing protein [Kitasatospora sp. NPDC057692]|uniref:pentapeptide repeat-containing protein n=1 Tax=Kitasatospora sp. NPDC057692 TaxID=3346215 RepID=UPI003686DAB3
MRNADLGVDVTDGLPSKRKKAELKPIDGDVDGPDRLLMERLRELYEGSSWVSLREFSEAIGRVRAGRLGTTLDERPDLKPDVGTLSYYMRGGGRSGARGRPRRVTEEFLHELFQALEEEQDDGRGEWARGFRLTEDVRADTLRLYVEAIRVTQPVRARLLELQTEHADLGDRYEGLRQLVDDLRDELEQARVERDALDGRNKLLREQADLDREALRANEDLRAVLTARIGELKDDLARAQQDRDHVRREYEALKNEMRVVVEAAAVERQVLVEQHEAAVTIQAALLEQLQRDAQDEKAKRLTAETQLRSVYQELTAPMPNVAIEPAPRGPRAEDVVAVLARLGELPTTGDERAIAGHERAIVSQLVPLLRVLPRMADTALEPLCAYVRRVRSVDRVEPGRGGRGSAAVQLIVDLLGWPHAARTSVDLTRTDLSFMTFQGRDLRYARLTGCRLRRVNFRGTNLANADLRRADLRIANFTGATLHGTNMEEAAGLRVDALAAAKIDKNTIPPEGFVLIRKPWGRWVLAESERSATDERRAASHPATSVGQLLQQGRSWQGRTLSDVAARLGVTEELVAKIESDDAQSLRLRDLVMDFALDVEVNPVRIRSLLERQVSRGLERFLNESRP